MEKQKISIIWSTSDHRAKRSEIWDSRVVVQYKWGTYMTLYRSRSFFRSFGAQNLNIGNLSAKFPMFRFSMGYSCRSFHPISTKLYGKQGNLEVIQAVTFWRSTKCKQFYDSFKCLLTRLYGAKKNSNVLLQFSSNLSQTL